MKLHLFCEGEPVHSTFALASGDFRYAGELMASSIIQGGPAPNFLAKWVYMYITGGLDKVELCVSQIKEEKLKDIVEKVTCCLKLLIIYYLFYSFLINTKSIYG